MSVDRVLVQLSRAMPGCGGHLPSFRYSLLIRSLCCWQLIVREPAWMGTLSRSGPKRSELVHEPPR
jgi:hypothetical protein